MDLHYNAQSCPHSRVLMVDRVQRDDPVIWVTAEFGSESANRLQMAFPLSSARV